MKKVIGYLIIIVLFGGSICGITFGIMYANNEKYIEENSSTIEEVADLRSQINDYQIEIDEITNELTLALNQNDIDKDTIASLNEELLSVKDELQATSDELSIAYEQISSKDDEISELTEQYQSLSETLTETQTQVETLNGQIEALSNQLEEALTQNSLDKETISSLNSQISSLEIANDDLESQVVSLGNEITRLEAELEAYENMNLDDYYKVEFINSDNDSVVSSSYVLQNSKLIIPEITKTYDRWCYGWATSESLSDVADLSEYVVNSDCTFYSVMGNNIDLVIEHDNSFLSGSNETVYRYGEDLTVADVLIVDSSLSDELESGVVSFEFVEGVSLTTQLKDLPTKNYSVSGTIMTPKYLEYDLVYHFVQTSKSAGYVVGDGFNDNFFAGIDSNEGVPYFQKFSQSNITFTVGAGPSRDDLVEEVTITDLQNTAEVNFKYMEKGIRKYAVYEIAPFENFDIIVAFGIRLDGDYAYKCGISIYGENYDYSNCYVSGLTFDLLLENSYVSYLDAFIDEDYWIVES